MPPPTDFRNPLTDEDVARLVTQGTPSGVYLHTDDNFRLTVFNALAGAIVTVRSRFLLSSGEIVPSVDTFTPASDRSSSSTVIPAPDGWCLGVEVFCSTGSPKRGQAYVILEVFRGLTAAGQPLQLLLQGYVGSAQKRAWPGSPIELSTDGAGLIVSTTGTNPAPGVEVSQTVAAGNRQRLLGLDVALVTSGIAGTREVTLVIDDGTTILHEITAGVSQTLSLTRRYSFGRLGRSGAGVASTIINVPLPDIFLEAGFRVRTVTTAIDAGDDYGAPQLHTEDWMAG